MFSTNHVVLFIGWGASNPHKNKHAKRSEASKVREEPLSIRESIACRISISVSQTKALGAEGKHLAFFLPSLLPLLV